MSLPPEWAELTEEYTRWNLKFAARTTNSLNVTSELSDIAELDYFNHHKHTSEAPVPTRHTAPEGGNTAEYNDAVHKSMTEDSGDDEKSPSNAPRWEPTRDPEATKGGTLAATLWFFCLASAIATDIDERDGGYINILVSIEPEVPPDENIIRNLKALLESSSLFLHRATNGRVYFKSFVIEVPKYWPKRKVDRHLGATQFLNSDVRIVNSKSCGFQEPCTVTSQGCQGKGDYVFIPAEYLQHLGPLTAETNESAAYTFVHEWAHLRYGVFDEYGTRGDDSFPETYCVDGEVRLSACSQNISFTAKLKNGSSCPTDEKCRFGKDCIVTHHIRPEKPTESSIMFMPYVKNVRTFVFTLGVMRCPKTKTKKISPTITILPMDNREF
nr:calcium-activated chloride channel regulator 1-like [Dermacentor andersoni]